MISNAPHSLAINPASGTHSLVLGELTRCRLVAPLFERGMSEVFLGTWQVAPGVHRPVVIKRLRREFRGVPKLEQMFLDEARLVCRLDHENIARTLEIGLLDGQCSIVSEYLVGQSLESVLKRAEKFGKLPVEALLAIAIRVLDALNDAHSKTDYAKRPLQIVHGDITPKSVFVTSEGLVKLLDFGVARAGSWEGRTATGMLKGKLGYVAPEQARGEDVDRRADIWSLGVVLWEALTGTALFKRESDAETLRATLTSPIPRAASLRHELGREVDALLAVALQRNPALRHQTALSMKQNLERILAKSGRSWDMRSLGRTMHSLFPEEIREEQGRIAELMAEADDAPRESIPPASADPVVLSSAGFGGDFQRSGASQKPSLRSTILQRGLLVTLLALLAFTIAFQVAARLTPANRALPPTAAAELPEARPSAAAHSVTEIDLDQPPPAPVAPLPPASLAPPTPPSSIAAPSPATASTPVTALLNPRIRIAPNPTAARQHGSAVAAPSPVSRPKTPTLQPALPVPPSTGMGFLTLDTSPWSLVSADGKPLGQTPLVGVALAGGTHRLSLRNPELGLQAQQMVEIVPGKTTNLKRLGLE